MQQMRMRFRELITTAPSLMLCGKTNLLEDKMDKRGCKHLDYDGKYIGCKLVERDGYRWWERSAMWTEGPGNEGNAKNVQFCKKRGRIPGIAQCINPGEMSCFEPQEELTV
jgi:hypothetical protein